MSDLIISQKRKINVVNVGGKNFTMESTASTRGELEAEMSRMNMNVSFAHKKVIIGETKNSLDVAGSVLPASNFTLFIMPSKTKAGGAVRDAVKDVMKKYPVEAKAHFSAEKSYTVKKDSELEQLIKTWKTPKQAAEVPASKVKEKKPVKGEKDTGIADLVDTVVEHAKKKYEAGDHTMTAGQHKAAKEQVREEQAAEYDMITSLKAIHAVVMESARKIDQLLEFAGNSIKYASSGTMMPATMYGEPVHELEESEISKVQRQIEREFPDVKNY